MTTQGDRPQIINGKLAIVQEGGSVALLGIRTVRQDIAQIEGSELTLKESTRARLAVLKAGVDLWERYKRRNKDMSA